MFRMVIKYMKNGMECLPQLTNSYESNLFLKELDFWGIPFKENNLLTFLQIFENKENNYPYKVHNKA